MSLQAKATRVVSQLMSLNMLMWLTMLTFFAGILVLAAAAYMALATVLAPAWSALITGVGLLVVCGCLALLIRWATRPPRSTSATSKATQRSQHSGDQNQKPVINDREVEWARRNSDFLTACALGAGIAIVASSNLRRYVVRSAGPLVARRLAQSVQDFMREDA